MQSRSTHLRTLIAIAALSGLHCGGDDESTALSDLTADAVAEECSELRQQLVQDEEALAGYCNGWAAVRSIQLVGPPQPIDAVQLAVTPAHVTSCMAELENCPTPSKAFACQGAFEPSCGGTLADLMECNERLVAFYRARATDSCKTSVNFFGRVPRPSDPNRKETACDRIGACFIPDWLFDGPDGGVMRP